MKIIQLTTTIIALIFISTSSYGQLKETYRDDFDNNKTGWSIGSKAKSSLAISDGVMKIEYKELSGKKVFLCDGHINPNGDYKIETSLKQTLGEENVPHGLTWGFGSMKNSYYFQILTSGNFLIYYLKQGKFKIIKKLSPSSSIKNSGQANKITIEKKGAQLNFYINDTKVHSCPNKAPLGRYLGFSMSGKVAVHVEYLVIKQSKGEINLLSGGVSKFSKKNMGVAINTKNSEIAPVISPDGNTLYVAREVGFSNHNIWYSTKKSDGTWSKLKNIGKPLNNSADNVVIAITPDNNTIMVEGLYNKDGSYKSDQGISVAYRNATGDWDVPVKINIKNFYNLDEYESFSPTGDRQTIIMSVERSDGYGKKDLYVSFRKSDGTYSKPKNMGTVLNSYDNEGTPYIAPDNKTLYYYSYTEPGYGSADIFVSKRLDDTWTNWSTPKNLGKKINTSGWDVYYTTDAKAEFAYLVSAKFSYGKDDIYTIKLSEEEKPDPVVLMFGKVLDKKTNLPISANIIYEDAANGKIVGQARSNPKTGEYKVILPYGKSYRIRGTKKGYFATDESINLKKVMEYKELKRDLYLAPMEKEKTILLKDVHFYSGKAKLMPASYTELNRLATEMKANKKMTIEIHGHTENNPGYEDKLLALSQKRADAVKAYIKSKGIPETKIKTKAFGGTEPVGTNKTEAGRKLNRRVEFRIISK